MPSSLAPSSPSVSPFGQPCLTAESVLSVAAIAPSRSIPRRRAAPAISRVVSAKTSDALGARLDTSSPCYSSPALLRLPDAVAAVVAAVAAAAVEAATLAAAAAVAAAVVRRRATLFR